MKRLTLLIVAFVVILPPAFAADAQFRRLPVKEFRDKMQGAWLGQMIGVGWGAPTEFKVKGEIIPEDKFPPWKPEMVNQHNNDDCYVEMTFLRTLELHGFDAPIRQAGIDFANSGYRLWHANKAGRDNLRAGIAPPDSGHPKFNAHADDIDYQIEADFSGIIAPGLPTLAIALGEKFGRLMNYGDGLYAGQFVGGMYAEAYFESDPWKLIAAGLKCVPPDSQYAGMIRDLLKWCRENPDWTKTWELVEAKYHKDPNYTHPFCSKPGGKGEFSIDAKLNGAYIIMGLLYGAGDPDKTIAISCRCGQDSDCNPANAAGVLFAALGASKIPARFTEKLDTERKFSFTGYALPQVYEVSETLVRQAVARGGGRIEKDASGEEVLLIPVHTPKPSALERSWEPGPAANVRFTPEEMAQIKAGAGWKIVVRKPAAPIRPLPDKVACAVPDRQDFQVPDRVRLTGWVGLRVDGNEANRLAKIDTDRLLEGYRKRPGRQSWDGEHVGKWLHAATLAWVNTGDPALRAKLDRTVVELAKCQLADGYLGTYLDKDRWSHWDVWAHKYNLIGLLTYIRYTGNLQPLPTCRRMADLLCNTFGDEPGKRDLITAGHHTGMAPTSVLEPMVLLYRFTGEPRYLDFCKYILRSWEQPNGPHIVSRLLELKRVDKVGNAKAYEMLSCLNGALELYRTTGDRQLFDACLNAWRDIVDKRLYLTGTASYRELFHDDFDLPNTNNGGETCVTVTWLQFNAQLLRLTGEARFAEQLERVVLNQLLGAQQPDCAAWGYYVQMEGVKPYSATLDGHCCLSSGPRGVALIPTFAVSTDSDGAVVNLYDAGVAYLTLRDGTALTLKIETRYPADGRIRIIVEPATPKDFSVKLRIPVWCERHSITPSADARRGDDGYTVLRRTWKTGDAIELNLKLEPRVIAGDHLNQGKAAVLYGPLVLAADESLLADAKQPLGALALAKPETAALAVTPEPAVDDWRTWPGAQFYRIKAVTRRGGAPFTARLLPFADAGATKARYKVWLPLAGQLSSNALLAGVESRSRMGNQNGSINDDDFDSIVVTFDGKPAKEDWFAVTLDAPAAIRRVVFAHGKNFHDGGWFDASAGNPRIQVQRERGGAWETVGELADFPATTATDNKKLKPGQTFTMRLPEPVKALAVRVIGKPACGDKAAQAFSSCAELQAFAD